MIEVMWALYCLVVTLIPGRMARLTMEKDREVLAIKRRFVKGVSKGINSPLYVCRAGLELLKSEITQLGDLIPIKVIKLLDNIYYASSTAMNSLNDLLQYENLDTGVFKLNTKEVSIKNFRKGRLQPLQYLALKNQVQLIIRDDVIVSEYFDDSTFEKNINISLSKETEKSYQILAASYKWI